MKKTIFIMAVLCIGMIGSAQAITVELIAGQYMPVGTVQVTMDGDDILVKYMLEGECEGVLLTETHLHVSNESDDFDGVVNGKGNPKIGKFDYSMDHDPGVTEYEYRVLAENLPPGGPPYYIAAHGVTGTEYCSADELPGVVTGEVCWPTGDPSKYFALTISGDGVLDGDHDAWCADPGLKVGLSLALGNCTGDVDWAVVTDVPSEINCLLNLYELGLTVGRTGDMQLAVWILIEGLEDLDALDALYPDKRAKMISYYGGTLEEQAANVAAILELVAEQCDGFEPGCCDVMGVFLVPVDPLVLDPLEYRQPILIAIPAPCCETVWGFGGDAVGIPFAPMGDNDKRSGSWAMYFEFSPPII